MAYFIAAVSIKAEAFTAQACIFCILADDFKYAFETAEERQAHGVQADQHFIVWKIFATMIDYNRHLGGDCFIVATVRHKGSNGMLPQQKDP